MTFNLRQFIAKRALQRMVDRERESSALKDYNRRRQAALKGLARKREQSLG
jgi:hypothetical protein